MKFNNQPEQDESKPDYFEGPDVPESPAEERRRFKPDDPRYWDRPESQWDHLSFLRKWKFWGFLLAGALAVCFITAVWIRYFRPYARGGVQYGYVEQIEERGLLFKTFEGTLLPYASLMDTTRPYSHDFVFTATDDRVAAALKRASLAHRPVKVEFTRYAGALPWRGESTIIIERVDSVNPLHILPPDRRPQ